MTKRLLGIYVIVLYLMQVLFILSALAKLEYINIRPLVTFIPALLFGSLSLLMVVFNILLSMTNILSDNKKLYIPFYDVMKTKLLLIPYYLINFVICFLIIFGLLNPFTIAFVPLVIVVLFVLTYLTLIATSSHSIAYLLYTLNQETKIKNPMLHLAFHMIFIFDVIDSVIVYKIVNKENNNLNEIN